MDGLMRLVDASKRALASPNRRVVNAGTDDSTRTSKESNASLVEACSDAMTAPNKEDASETGAKPLHDTSDPSNSVDVVNPNECITTMQVKDSIPDPTTLPKNNFSKLGNNSLGVRKPKVHPPEEEVSIKPEGFLGVRKPRVHPPEQEESIKPDVANLGAVIMTTPVEVVNVDGYATLNLSSFQPRVVDLVLNDDEVIDVDLTTASYCQDVYEFKGPHQEFEKRPSETRNFKGTLGKILTGVKKTGYGEIDLYHLNKWYHGLRFSPMVKDEADIDGNKWHFRLVLIYPGDNEKSNEVHGFIPFLSKFYRKAFSDTEATRKTLTWL